MQQLHDLTGDTDDWKTQGACATTAARIHDDTLRRHLDAGKPPKAARKAAEQARDQWITRWTLDLSPVDDAGRIADLTARLRPVCLACPVLERCRDHALTSYPRGQFVAGEYALPLGLDRDAKARLRAELGRPARLGQARAHARDLRCRNGHVRTEDNTRRLVLADGRVTRTCRTCTTLERLRRTSRAAA